MSWQMMVFCLALLPSKVAGISGTYAYGSAKRAASQYKSEVSKRGTTTGL